MGKFTDRVIATKEAIELIGKLQKEYGEILFHQSGGCCEGSVPLCYKIDDFNIGSNDVELGELSGAKFYMAKSQYEYYKHTQIILEASNGNGSEFSLEYGSGSKFTFTLRLFNDEEISNLKPLDK